MLVSGYVALQALNEVNQRNEEMVQLQRKIGAYRQLNHDTLVQLYSVASALLKPDERSLQATLRQVNRFGYDLDRLQFVAQDEKEIFVDLRKDYEEFIRIVTEVIGLIREGRGDEGRELQFNAATPHSERLERLTNELVNKAEADMVVSVDASNETYATSRNAVTVLAVASVVLALLLGYAISSSIVRPVRAMEARMQEIAKGDFTSKVEVANKDELGVLAADLNRMSEQLGEAHRELEAVSRHKSEFLAGMSHELRTPLNAIIGFSEVLKDGLFGQMKPKQDEYVRDIHTSGQHLLSLINDILDLSKVESGRMELHLTSINVPVAIGDALTLVRERASKHGVKLSSEIDENINALTGDERKVKQILLNLLSNAVKFTPAGGEVTVRAAPTVDGIQISVIDTGIGIAEKDHQAIFDAFQQGEGGHKPGVEGTGLGLSLTRKLVELHNGRIWVDSKISEGSTFSFTLVSQS